MSVSKPATRNALPRQILVRLILAGIYSSTANVGLNLIGNLGLFLRVADAMGIDGTGAIALSSMGLIASFVVRSVWARHRIRRPARTVVLGAWLLAMAGGTAMALAIFVGPGLMAAGQAAVGAAGTAMTVFQSAIQKEAAEHMRTSPSTWIQLIETAFARIIGVAAGTVVAVAVPWPWVMAGYAAIALLMGAGLLLVKPPSHDVADEHGPVTSLKTLLNRDGLRPRFLGGALAFATNALVQSLTSLNLGERGASPLVIVLVGFGGGGLAVLLGWFWARHTEASAIWAARWGAGCLSLAFVMMIAADPMYPTLGGYAAASVAIFFFAEFGIVAVNSAIKHVLGVVGQEVDLARGAMAFSALRDALSGRTMFIPLILAPHSALVQALMMTAVLVAGALITTGSIVSLFVPTRVHGDDRYQGVGPLVYRAPRREGEPPDALGWPTWITLTFVVIDDQAWWIESGPSLHGQARDTWAREANTGTALDFRRVVGFAEDAMAQVVFTYFWRRLKVEPWERRVLQPRMLSRPAILCGPDGKTPLARLRARGDQVMEIRDESVIGLAGPGRKAAGLARKRVQPYLDPSERWALRRAHCPVPHGPIKCARFQIDARPANGQLIKVSHSNDALTRRTGPRSWNAPSRRATNANWSGWQRRPGLPPSTSERR
jgi:hypothetical protein